MTKFIALQKLCRDDVIEPRIVNVAHILHVSPYAVSGRCRIDFVGKDNYWRVDHSIDEMMLILEADDKKNSDYIKPTAKTVYKTNSGCDATW